MAGEDGQPIVLRAHDLSAAHAGNIVFRGVNLALRRGELTALIGPNGSGKTTLIHALAGLHRERRGELHLMGRPLDTFPRREIARRLALVPQFASAEFDVTVAETVAMGRYPHLGPLTPLKRVDREAVTAALHDMNLSDLRDRPLGTLSGGERQRVHLARALTQDVPIFLLDEPVANLDLRYQQETYQRLRVLADERSLAILVADHHLNLIAATADRIVILHEGRLWADGTPREIITTKMIRTVFGARMCVTYDEGGRPQCQWA